MVDQPPGTRSTRSVCLAAQAERRALCWPPSPGGSTLRLLQCNGLYFPDHEDIHTSMLADAAVLVLFDDREEADETTRPA